MQTSQIVDLERMGSCERYPGLSGMVYSGLVCVIMTVDWSINRNL